jgi:hypothetical protein
MGAAVAPVAPGETFAQIRSSGKIRILFFYQSTLISSPKKKAASKKNGIAKLEHAQRLLFHFPGLVRWIYHTAIESQPLRAPGPS